MEIITPRITPENIQYLNKDHIIVVGTNLIGVHGRGAALTAFQKFGLQ